MRKVALSFALLVVAMLVLTVTPSDAWRGGRGHYHGGRGYYYGGRGHFYGPRPFYGAGYWWGRPYWWGAPYYAPYYSGYYYYPPAPYYSYPPPAVPAPPAVAQAPENGVQVAPAPEPQAYWYYCASVGAYYPTAPSCAEEWIKVPPRSD